MPHSPQLVLLARTMLPRSPRSYAWGWQGNGGDVWSPEPGVVVRKTATADGAVRE